MIYLAYQVFRQKSSVGDFTVMVSSSQQLTSQLISFLGAFPQLYEHSLYIDHYRTFMEYRPQIEENKMGFRVPVALDLYVKDISFRYTEDGVDVLKSNACFKK